MCRLLISICGLLISVSVTSFFSFAHGDTEEGQDKGSEDKDEQAEDDGVLDGGGVEGEGGGPRVADCDVPEPGIPFLFNEVGAYAGGEESNGQDFPHHFYKDLWGVWWGGEGFLKFWNTIVEGQLSTRYVCRQYV